MISVVLLSRYFMVLELILLKGCVSSGGNTNVVFRGCPENIGASLGGKACSGGISGRDFVSRGLREG